MGPPALTGGWTGSDVKPMMSVGPLQWGRRLSPADGFARALARWEMSELQWGRRLSPADGDWWFD